MAEITENIQEGVPRFLQQEAMQILKDRNIGYDQLADMLNIFPDGARALLSANNWPADTGFRVLDALGVDVDISIK